MDLELCDPDTRLDSAACEAHLRQELCRDFVAVEGPSKTRYGFQAVMPAFLCPSLWRRHGYSLGDIKATLAHFPSGQLWQLLMSERVPSGKSLSCNSLREKLVEHFAADCQAEGSALRGHKHTPPVPGHALPFQADAWQRLRLENQLLKVKGSACYFASLGSESEGGLLMGRVVPLDVFRSVYVNLRELPVVLQTPQGPLAVLEEAFLLERAP